MPVVNPEQLTQVVDFEDPTVLNVFGFERIFDSNGFPYVSFSPTDYEPDGPQMKLDYFPTDDVSGRKKHEGIVNVVERRNSQEYFGKAMELLRSLRSEYIRTTDAQEPLSYSDSLRLAHMGIELPRYLLWKQDAVYKNGELPPETVLLNRALRGFHGLVTAISWIHPGERTPKERQEFLATVPFPASDVTDFLLAKRGLENDLVCAGHWNMITEMLGIIEGPATPELFTDPVDIFYEPNRLLDFAKSLRSLWDVVYPNIEQGIKQLKRDPNLEANGLEAFDNAHKMANMANFLILSVMGHRPEREIDVPEIIESLFTYSERGREREQELHTAITKFRA